LQLFSIHKIQLKIRDLALYSRLITGGPAVHTVLSHSAGGLILVEVEHGHKPIAGVGGINDII
jgi:hypothetical protein